MTRMAREVVPLALTLCFALPIDLVAAANCFTSDGKADLDQQPCPGVNDTSPGPCCLSTAWPNVDSCMSNGLCLSTVGGYMYAGGCTDRAWSNAYCNIQRQCVRYYGANYAVVTACYLPHSAPGSMCCGYAGDSRTQKCCANNSGFNFSRDGSAALFLGPLNGSSLLNVTAAVAGRDGGGSMSTADKGNGSSATGTAGVVPPRHVPRSVAIGVGVGLGVPLLIALASVAWLWRAWSKQKQTNASVGESAPGYAPGWEAPESRPAELKASNDVQEAPSQLHRVEVPAERM